MSPVRWPEVGLLKSLLEDAGIASEIRNESSSANFPGAAFQPELWVLNDTDYEKACEVRDSCCKLTPTTPESSRITESLRGLYLYLGFVCFAGGVVLLWQGVRADSVVAIGAALGVCGFLAVVFFVSAKQLRLAKSRRTKDS